MGGKKTLSSLFLLPYYPIHVKSWNGNGSTALISTSNFDEYEPLGLFIRFPELTWFFFWGCFLSAHQANFTDPLQVQGFLKPGFYTCFDS